MAKEGRYRLVLKWNNPVELAEVIHTAEDCTRNGDHPADEFVIVDLDTGQDIDPDDADDNPDG